MSRGKRYQPEQVVNLLRQIEVAVANGKTTAQACKEAEIVEQTYFPGARSMVGCRWIRRRG
jgi:putative transposase